MSPAEISFRIRQKIRYKGEIIQGKLRKNPLFQDFYVPRWISDWDLERNPFPFAKLNFFGLSEDRKSLIKEYKTRFPNQYSLSLKRANNLIDGKFNLLGLKTELSNPIQWNRNPETSKEFPLLHHSLINTGNSEPYGDVKFVWELNRHQFFIEVAKAYFLTGDEKYATTIQGWFNSWIKDTPYKLGVNNTSVLEHAVRIFSWIWTYYFTQDSPIWTQEQKKLLAKNLLLQGKLTEENLSYFYSPYNHLIGELAALAFLGVVYQDSPISHTWGEKYWSELEDQIEKQFHKDGFTIEQASYYHHFTWGFYLMVALLRKQNQLPVSQKVYTVLEKAIEFSMGFTRPDGQLPRLGDIDSARSIYFYHPDPMWNLRPFLAIGATLFQRGDLKCIAQENCEEVLWLFGKEGLEIFDNLKPTQPTFTSRPCFDSGYFIMRDSWEKTGNYCCFDCGEIAHGVFKDETPSAAHGHGDILSFELCLAGDPIIIDPGFHTYFGPLEWHRNFRSTRGHNTIEVNHAGQAVHEGRISWSNVSSSKLDQWIGSTNIDLVGGQIDRFAKLGKDLFHRRYVLFRKGFYFLIMDEVNQTSLLANENGKMTAEIESSLHFAPGTLIHREDQLFFNDSLVASLSVPDKSRVVIKTGGKNPDEGWIAPGYGQKMPAPVLRIESKGSIPAHFGMLFPIQMKADQSSIHLRRTTINQKIQCYEVQLCGFQEKIFINPNRELFSPLNSNIKTDALCSLVKKEENQEITYHLLGLTCCKSHGDDSKSFMTPEDFEKGAAGLALKFGASGNSSVKILNRV